MWAGVVPPAASLRDLQAATCSLSPHAVSPLRVSLSRSPLLRRTQSQWVRARPCSSASTPKRRPLEASHVPAYGPWALGPLYLVGEVAFHELHGVCPVKTIPQR